MGGRSKQPKIPGQKSVAPEQGDQDAGGQIGPQGQVSAGAAQLHAGEVNDAAQQAAQKECEQGEPKAQKQACAGHELDIPAAHGRAAGQQENEHQNAADADQSQQVGGPVAQVEEQPEGAEDGDGNRRPRRDLIRRIKLCIISVLTLVLPL